MKISFYGLAQRKREMEALVPAGEALAAAGASAGVPPACMRDRSAPGTRLELRTVALLRPRHEPLSHSLCRSRSQAEKASALEVGMRRLLTKKVAICADHLWWSLEHIGSAGDMVALLCACAVQCLCRVVQIALCRWGWVGCMGGQGLSAGRFSVAPGGLR